MLDVGLAQAHADRPLGYEALGFVEIKLVIVALAFALQDDQFIMRARNGALQLGAGAGQILACGLNRLALLIELRLNFLPASLGHA